MFWHVFQEQFLTLNKLGTMCVAASDTQQGLLVFSVKLRALRSSPCSLLLKIRTDGTKGEEGLLCVKRGFYADISWKSRCHIEINVWPHFWKILLVFEVLTLLTPSQRDAWKKLKLLKVGIKDASILAPFHGSHIDGIVCVKQMCLGLARTLKEY